MFYLFLLFIYNGLPSCSQQTLYIENGLEFDLEITDILENP